MRKFLVVFVVMGLSHALAGAAQAQPPEWPGFIGPTQGGITPGECLLGSTDLEAWASVVVYWEDAPQVPVHIEATLSVDQGPPVDVTSAFSPNPVEASGGSFDQSNARTRVPGSATSLVWIITVTPEDYAPVILSQTHTSSRNPSGFCAHLFECHPSYEGVCLPNDGQWVHCAGTGGVGQAVEGPITVVGYDYFGLDPDGDGIGCPVALVEAETAPAAPAPPVTARPSFTG